MSLTKVSYSMIDGEVVNILDYGASTSATASANQAAIQAAIDAAAGKTLWIPSGTYLCGPLTIKYAMRICGDSNGLYPTSYTTDASRLDFRGAVSAGAAAITICDGTNAIIGLVFEGLGMIGSNTFDGLKFGVDNTSFLNDGAFRDLNIYGFRKGIVGLYSYGCLFQNIRVQNTVTAAVLGSQFNNCQFDRCSFVNCTSVAVTHTNCEGVQYNSCEFANYDYADVPITLYQSSVTMVNPYFEAISHPYFVAVGAGTEASGFQSVFNMINALKFGGKIVYNTYTTVIVSGTPRGQCDVVGYYLTTPGRLIRVDSVGTNPIDTGRMVIKYDGGYAPTFNAYGAASLAYSVRRGSTGITNSGAAGTGIILSPGSLANGILYTLTIAMKEGVVPVTDMALRIGSITLDFSPSPSSGSAGLQQVTFIATANPLILMFVGQIFLYGCTIEAGNTRIDSLDGFMRETTVDYQGSHTAAPVAGSWNVGDIVWNSAPASGQPAGWICTVGGGPGTWKAMANLA